MSHVVFFRRDFRDPRHSSLSQPQKDLLDATLAAMRRRGGGPLDAVWAGDIFAGTATGTGAGAGAAVALPAMRQPSAYCPRVPATLGSGYENLVGSAAAADAFREAVVEPLLRPVTTADPGTGLASAAAPAAAAAAAAAAAGAASRSGRSCPTPRVVLLQRGKGSSSPRRLYFDQAFGDGGSGDGGYTVNGGGIAESSDGLAEVLAEAGRLAGVVLPEAEIATVGETTDLQKQVEKKDVGL